MVVLCIIEPSLCDKCKFGGYRGETGSYESLAVALGEALAGIDLRVTAQSQSSGKGLFSE